MRESTSAALVPRCCCVGHLSRPVTCAGTVAPPRDMRTIDDAELTGWQGFYVYYGCSVRDTVVVGAAPVLADHSTRPNSLVPSNRLAPRNRLTALRRHGPATRLISFRRRVAL